MVGEGIGDRCAAVEASLLTLDCCSCCRIRLCQRPVLWSCLHSYCEKCDAELFAAGSGPVACLVCESLVEPDRRQRDCHVVAAWAAAAADGPSDASNRSACDLCRDENRESEASHQCSGCKLLLCDICRQWHERFPCANGRLVSVNVDSTATNSATVYAVGSSGRQQQQQQQQRLSLYSNRPGEASEGRRLPPPPPCGRICTAHLELLDFYCLECVRLKCTTCIKDCMEARHDSVGVSNSRTVDRAQAAVRTLKEVRSRLDRLEAEITAAADALAADAARFATNHQLALEAVSRVYHDARADINAAYDQQVDAARCRQDDDAAAVARASAIDERLRYAVKYGGVLVNAAVAALAAATAHDENRSGGTYSSNCLPAATYRFTGAAFAPVDWMLEQRAAMLAHFDALSAEGKQLLGVESNVTPTDNVIDDELENFTMLVCDADIGDLREAAKRFISCNVSSSIFDDSTSPSAGYDRDNKASTGRSLTESRNSISSRENRATTSLADGDPSMSSSMAAGPPSLLVERCVSDQTSIDRLSDSLTVRHASNDRSSDSLPARRASVERSSDSLTGHLATTTSSTAALTAEPVEVRSHTDRSHFEGSPLATIFVDEIVDSFRAVATCHDVACTNDGHVLLAALQHGLKQYEASTGRKRRTWYPASGEGRQRIVSTVDVLDDGRAVVGLIGARCVAVLRREPPDVWVEESRLEVGVAPYRLAVRGERLAIACADVRESGKSYGWQPGARLCFGRLLQQDGGSSSSGGGATAGDGRSIELVSSRTLSYGALGVALLDDAVVVVSSHERQPAAEEGTDSQFIVEAYGDDGSGALLWRYGSAEDVFDLCTIATSCVVYLALPRSLRIMALNGLDGTVLTAVVKEGTHTVVAPNRLAVSLPAAADVFPSSICLLVVLSGNGVVSLYPILRSIPAS